MHCRSISHTNGIIMASYDAVNGASMYSFILGNMGRGHSLLLARSICQ